MSKSKNALLITITCLVTMIAGTVSAEARVRSGGSSYKPSSSIKKSTHNHVKSNYTKSSERDRSRNAHNMQMAVLVLAASTRSTDIDKLCAKKVMDRELDRAERKSKAQAERIIKKAEFKIKKECKSAW